MQTDQIDRYGFVADPDATCSCCGSGHDPAELGYIFHADVIARLIAKHGWPMTSPGHAHFDCFVSYANHNQINILAKTADR